MTVGSMVEVLAPSSMAAAAITILVLVAFVMGARGAPWTAATLLALGPLALWGVTESTGADAPLEPMTTWITTLKTSDWAALLTTLGLFTIAIAHVSEALLLTLLFPLLAFVASLIGAYLVFATELDLALGVSGSAHMIVGGIIGGCVATLGLIAIFRAAPNRIE